VFKQFFITPKLQYSWVYVQDCSAELRVAIQHEKKAPGYVPNIGRRLHVSMPIG
jgi:hypothetical protein